MSKTLVAYFSASGATAKLAKTLAEAVEGDLYEIEPVEMYTRADLDWNNKSSRSSKEMNDPDARPGIQGRVVDMDEYDVVFVGFPIWWYEAPRIIDTFLESYDLSGKTLVPFVTSGGSGMGRTGELLAAISPEATWLTGKRLSPSASQDELTEWVRSLGL